MPRKLVGLAAGVTIAALLTPISLRAQGLRPVTQNVFDVTDRDHDGKITPEEFRARMHEVFFLLDRNKDGSLTRDELSARAMPRSALPTRTRTGSCRWTSTSRRG